MKICKLIILDYSTSMVHFYKVDNSVEINEEYISNIGYNPSNCAWMFGSHIDTFKHKNILK